jgi:hypothetical protein
MRLGDGQDGPAEQPKQEGAIDFPARPSECLGTSQRFVTGGEAGMQEIYFIQKSLGASDANHLIAA